MRADGVHVKKIKCPHCGKEQNIFYIEGVEDSFLNAKIRHADKNLK